MKSNVLPFPSLRRMPPDPPRRRWLRALVLQMLVLAILVGIVILVDAIFGR